MFEARIVAAGCPAAAPARDRGYVWAVAGLWLLASAVLCVLHLDHLTDFTFPDVDDQLRLVEVRDWLHGQAFTDVTQYRMNQPFGAPMHWSRLVDLPIAALIVLLRPLLGAHGAEAVTCAVVPLVTLGLAMLFTGLIARRLAGRGAGLLATALAPTAVAAVAQMQPMRIDHHGWEIVLSLMALHAAFRPEAGRGGFVAGLALAFALQISLEVLPFAVALGAALGLHWVVAPTADTRRRLVWTVATMAIAEALLFLVFHRPAQWGVFCDAISPPHLLGLGAAAAGILVVTWLDPRKAGLRAAGLGLVALVAAAAFRAVPPGCGLDAFAALEPIVRTYWYDKTAEGLPVWRDGATKAVGLLGFPVAGLGCALALWRENRRADWAIYGAMLFACVVVAMLVARATALANLMALPAAACVSLRLFARAQASGRMPVRVLGSVAALAALSPWAPGVAAVALIPTVGAGTSTDAHTCDGIANIRALRGLPTARIFAPFDFGPAILLETSHAVLASSHHRNHVAMAQELTAWLGSDAAAHAILRARGIDYVVACPDHPEIETYASAAPHGFAAHLKAGRAPAWLDRVTLPGTTAFGLWRVRG